MEGAQKGRNIYQGRSIQDHVKMLRAETVQSIPRIVGPAREKAD